MLTRADIAIKRAAFSCALDMKPKGELKAKLDSIVSYVANNTPSWVIDYRGYIKGAQLTTEIASKALYEGTLKPFIALKKSKATKPLLGDINTPRELMETLSHKPSVVEYKKRKAWNKIHGEPNCNAYATKLRQHIEAMAKRDPTSVGDNTKPMNAFAKAELDLRHEAQMDKLDALREHGYRLCWLSSHADCSPRCAKWQGKLVDINNKSDLPSKRMPYKKDGYVVYSLPSIMEETDKNGYNNTIINGFNCRHHLIPYSQGSKPPKHIDERKRKQEYEIEQNLREYERKVRDLKRQSIMYNEIDKKRAQAFANEATSLTREYKSYARENGYQWHNYRTEV